MLLIIIFNFVPSINAHSSFFHSQDKNKIKLADYETLQQEWLATQPKMKRYDIPVLSKESIPKILKYFNIETSTYGLDNPAYNPYAKDFFCWKLKNPTEGLLGVNFKARQNPFKIKYPNDDDEYTLDDLLKYEIAIEEAFVFWDAQQKNQEEKVNVELISIDLFVDQSKEEAINNYLIKNQIINQPKLIKLGCYNITPTTGLIAPLPSREFHGIEIASIYFDDGVRLLPENENTRYFKLKIEHQEQRLEQALKELSQTKNEELKESLATLIAFLQKTTKTLYQQMITNQTSTIDDLLKLSNGAKNIYLFYFNTQKRIKSIELPDDIDPYQAIRTWKRDNNLFDYEGEFIRQTDSMKVVLAETLNRKLTISGEFLQIKNIFETEKEKFIISCKDVKVKKRIFEDCGSKYINWLNQCYIKPVRYYTGNEVRDKFGRSSKTIYDENGNTHYYQYDYGFFFDHWYIDGNECARTYYHFLDTTPPPQKPQWIYINWY